MQNRDDKKLMGEEMYGIALMASGPYILVINFIFEPNSWREWFLRTMSFEIAVTNLCFLALIFLCLAAFSDRIPLAIRFGMVGLLVILGSFLKVSGDMAPAFAFLFLVIGAGIYLFLRVKRRRRPS